MLVRQRDMGVTMRTEDARGFARQIQGRASGDPDRYYFVVPAGAVRGLDTPAGVVRALADEADRLGGDPDGVVDTGRARRYADALEGWGNLGRTPDTYMFRVRKDEVHGYDVPSGAILGLAALVDRLQTRPSRGMR